VTGFATNNCVRNFWAKYVTVGERVQGMNGRFVLSLPIALKRFKDASETSGLSTY